MEAGHAGARSIAPNTTTACADRQRRPLAR